MLRGEATCSGLNGHISDDWRRQRQCCTVRERLR